jgi:hypothetical protein
LTASAADREVALGKVRDLARRELWVVVGVMVMVVLVSGMVVKPVSTEQLPQFTA